jgi:hypothetical protein
LDSLAVAWFDFVFDESLVDVKNPLEVFLEVVKKGMFKLKVMLKL